MSAKISIIIPNWNGRAFLVRCVGAILQSAAEYGAPFECLIMDDASSDGSTDDLPGHFSQVTVVRHIANEGFGAMVNEAAGLATGELLVLVNNDLIAKPGFIEQLCTPFEGRPMLFGVSGKTLDWESGKPNHVNMQGTWADGEINLNAAPSEKLDNTLFLQGGSCAMRRELFLELGGFFQLYAPGYWEDYDISYQALKAGYGNLYNPAAEGAHLGQGSMIRAYGREYISFVRERNRLLFHALNLNDEYYDEFWAGLPNYVRINQEGIRFKHRIRAVYYLWASRHLILKERKVRALRQVISDKELLGKRNTNSHG